MSIKQNQIKSFEDILAWKESKNLVLAIYSEFKNCNDYAFRDQIRRASVSVMNNIAEGFERMGDREFKKFLYIAKGSCAEVRSMLSLAIELKYISSSSYIILNEKSILVSKLLSGFIKKLG